MHSKTDYIYQYRVDFKPICDNVEMKKQMVAYCLAEDYPHVDFIFEGTMIFTFAKLSATEDSIQIEVLKNIFLKIKQIFYLIN